jgi:hypothetical protein
MTTTPDGQTVGPSIYIKIKDGISQTISLLNRQNGR